MIIDQSLISIELVVQDKEEAINKLCDIANNSGRLNCLKTYSDCVIKRESEVSTDMGYGIAIPHGKSDSVIMPFIVFAKLKNPIIWNEEEETMVNLIFMLGVPQTSTENIHLKIMAQLAGKLMDDEFLDELKNITDSQSALNCFKNIVI